MIPFEMINLDKPRRLRFGMRAIMEFEQVTGIKLMEMDGSPQTMINVLWFMLQQDEPGLTLESVCNLVDDHAESLAEVFEKIEKVLNGAFPEPDPNAKAPTAQ